jgi:hypothetical protein
MLDREQDKLIFEARYPLTKRTPEPAVAYAEVEYQKLKSDPAINGDPSRITDVHVRQFAAGWLNDWISQQRGSGEELDVKGFEDIFVAELLKLRDAELGTTPAVQPQDDSARRDRQAAVYRKAGVPQPAV